MKSKVMTGLVAAGMMLTVACAEKIEKGKDFTELRKPVVSDGLMIAKMNEAISGKTASLMQEMELQINTEINTRMDEAFSDVRENMEIAPIAVVCSMGISDLAIVPENQVKGLENRLKEKVDTKSIEDVISSEEKDGTVSVVKLNTLRKATTQMIAGLSVKCTGSNSVISVEANSKLELDNGVLVNLDDITGVELSNVKVAKLTPEQRTARIAEAKKQIIDLKLVDNVMVQSLNVMPLETAQLLDLNLVVVDKQINSLEAKVAECDEIARQEDEASGAEEDALEIAQDKCEDELEEMQRTADTDLGRDWGGDRDSMASDEVFSVAITNDMEAATEVKNHPINIADIQAIQMMSGDSAVAKENTSIAERQQAKVAGEINAKLSQNRVKKDAKEEQTTEASEEATQTEQEDSEKVDPLTTPGALGNGRTP